MTHEWAQHYAWLYNDNVVVNQQKVDDAWTRLGVILRYVTEEGERLQAPPKGRRTPEERRAWERVYRKRRRDAAKALNRIPARWELGAMVTA